MFAIACCLVVGLGLGLGFRISFSVLLVSCYAHVYVLVSIVIVTLPELWLGFGNKKRFIRCRTSLKMTCCLRSRRRRHSGPGWSRWCTETTTAFPARRAPVSVPVVCRNGTYAAGTPRASSLVRERHRSVTQLNSTYTVRTQQMHISSNKQTGLKSSYKSINSQE